MEDNFNDDSDFDGHDIPESLINFDGFIQFVLTAKYIQLFEIYDKNDQTVEDGFSDVINDYPFLLEENSMLYYKNFQKVYASYIELSDSDYNEIVPSLMEDVGLNVKSKKIPVRYLQILSSQEKNVLYIFLMVRVKAKQKRKRKTIEDFNKELNKALNDENYELAARLRDKITKFKKK
jgi:hypothetical protein